MIWTWLKKRRRRRWRALPFPAAWQAVLEEDWPYYSYLPGPVRTALQQRVQVFVQEIGFEGIAGFELTERIRLLVAAQACLLLAGREDLEFTQLRSVLLFPDTYHAPSIEYLPGEVIREESIPVQGESYDFGTVLLSWKDAWRGLQDDDDGRNLILHEFAHQLDQNDGLPDGTPTLTARHRYAAWQRIFQREYDRLRKAARRGRGTLLDTYGATDPAEFFAVATETFFERPQLLHDRHPELYGELRAFYGLDPHGFLTNES